MARYGDSHTNFDDTALIAGGLGGMAIAGALIGGVMNHRAKLQAERAQAWNEDAWRRALEISELLRKRDHERTQRSELENARLRTEIARLRGEPKIARARAMMGR